ncbi:MAG: cysteine hydrolase, partial [Alphaproteobacteria bacterium]|nr:cysteine hydrolase [Alphaproteobacteria bacterium]
MPIIFAEPYDYAFEPAGLALMAIDMQRDYLEPEGYGASLGLDVSACSAIVPTMQALITSFRGHGLPVIHTRQCHKPDLSDCPPAKLKRGRQKLKIGDPGPMGRLLICGEPGADIIPELYPQTGEIVIDKPGK